jgi:hypothetical protein
MVILNIAGIRIDLQILSNEQVDLSMFSLFQVNVQEAPDLQVSFGTVRQISCAGRQLFYERDLYWSENGEFTEVALWEKDKIAPIARLRANKKWDQIEIRIAPSAYPQYILKTLGEIAFRTSILFHSGLVVHAAAIEWQGLGIIFSAPAGTGKTTQANLWRDYCGAVVLNGDRPALRVLEGKTYVYGTPWSGSMPDFLNRKAPLTAVVLVKQAGANRLRELTLPEAVGLLAPRCFLPYWDRQLMDMALSNLSRVIAGTPVYLLECLPDRGAVELVRQRVK